MLECKEIRSFLADYAAGILDEETAAKVADHLLLCPICAGELERLEQPVEEVPVPVQPAEARSFATEDPLAAQKAAAPVQESPAEDAASAEAPASAAPKKKLRRRTKILLALLALLLVLGIGIGILHSRDVFDIRHWVKSSEGRFTAVVYAGDGEAKNGFRIRLWDSETKQWMEEIAFQNAEYGQMHWSEDSVYLAVSYIDEIGADQTVTVGLTQEGLLIFYLQEWLENYLYATGGYFGETPLTGVPSCRVLHWMPGSRKLLLYAEGVVDTEVDPNYGIELAETDKIRSQEDAGNLVNGYFVVDIDKMEIQVLTGFGLSGSREIAQQQDRLFSKFFSFHYADTMTDVFQGKKREVYHGGEALLHLYRMTEQQDILQMYYYMGDDLAAEQAFAELQPDLSVLQQIKQTDGIMLVLIHAKEQEDPITHAFLILPYGG